MSRRLPTVLVVGAGLFVRAGLALLAGSGLPTSGVAQDTPLWQSPPGHAFRVTSAQARSNTGGDDLAVASGAEVILLDAVGPGVVTRLWLTVESMDPHALRHTVLRMFWEGASSPCVEVPLADFFALGPGGPRDVRSEMVQVSGDGRGLSARWPMPYQSSARIQLRNDSGFPLRRVSWQVDGRTLDQPHAEPLRCFHAGFRQHDGPGDFVLADIGGAGHYVGTVLNVRSTEEGWPGEGDDRFYVDGEDRPSLEGTGLEDYFGDAWTFHEHQGAHSGVTLHQGTGAGALSSAYRWHLTDPIPFQESLKVEFERSGWALRGDTWELTSDRRDVFSGAAFWYQSEPHAPPLDLPMGPRRLAWQEYRVEAEDVQQALEVPVGAPAPVRQDGSFLAFGAQVVFAPPRREVAVLTLPLELAVDQEYDLFVRWTAVPHAATYRVLVDGEPLGMPHDLHADRARIREDYLGHLALTKGSHRVAFQAVGRHPAATGWTLALDTLILRW